MTRHSTSRDVLYSTPPGPEAEATAEEATAEEATVEADRGEEPEATPADD